MYYEEYKSRYYYPNTEVLINKQNIKDINLLQKVERTVTTYKLSQLYINPIEGCFDFDHFSQIHKFLFGDLYDFAGEIRDECIQKDNTLFCLPGYIYKNLNYIFKEMKYKTKDIKCEEMLINFLAHYYSEINIIHPFREGNGRTLREFLREFVLVLNKNISFGEYDLDYTLLDEIGKKKLMYGSAISAGNGDISLLRDVFENVLVNKLEKIEMKHL